MLKRFSLALAGIAIAASASFAAPLVTMTERPAVGGTANTAYDFYYSAGDGAEFTAYDLIVDITSGGILDPIRGGSGGQSSEGGTAIDTWANTVGSLLGAGPASYNFTTYNPGGFTPSPLPATALNWTVFDTLEGDGDGVGPGAPYHIARLLVSPGTVGTATFQAYNNQSGSTPTVFNFDIGFIPEPTSLGLGLMGALSLIGARRRFSA